MDSSSEEEPSNQQRVDAAAQQPLSSLQKQDSDEHNMSSPPSPPTIINVIDDDIDNIESPFKACNQAVAETLIKKYADELDLDDTTTQGGAEFNTPTYDPSSSNGICFVIDDTMAPVKEQQQQQPITTPITPDRTHKITVTTASSSSPDVHSTTSSITGCSDISTIQKVYQQYKRTKSRSLCLSGEVGGSLHDIIEGVQFCSMYFMEELCGGDDDDSCEDEEDNQNNKISKDDRMRETNNSFLGKMIQCGSIDNRCGNSGEDCSVVSLS
eukprot:scaffold23570_cov143-Skeletonema_dohrnii-CCMP3373.AAC.2